jgi:hypothetical protein
VPTVTASGRPTNAHEIKTLVLSRHPAIAIETSEEERADAALAAVAADTGLVRFDWTVTRGLVRLPATAPVYGTQDAGRMLASIGELGVEGLFVLKDFAAQLAAPPVSRAFRELLERFAGPGRLSTIVLVGASLELPAEVDPQVVRYAMRLPDRDEYRAAIAAWSSRCRPIAAPRSRWSPPTTTTSPTRCPVSASTRRVRPWPRWRSRTAPWRARTSRGSSS